VVEAGEDGVKAGRDLERVSGRWREGEESNRSGAV